MLQGRALKWVRPEVIPLAAVIFLLPWLRTPIQGPNHAWRQADVAAVARNLAFESPDIFHPRIDFRNEKSGITGMEFPLYPAIVATVMAATRSDADQLGKFVSLLAGAAVWWLLVRLLTRRWGLSRWAAHLACAAVPVFVTYSAVFMPETTALLLALLSALLLDEWWAHPRLRTLVLCGVCIGLAGLVRPYVIFWGLPMAIAAVVAARTDRSRLVPLALTGAVALVPFMLWYGPWCRHLVAAYGLDYFYMGGSVTDNLADLRTPAFRDQFVSIIKRFYLLGALVPLALVGLELSMRAARKSARSWWDITIVAVIPPTTLVGVLLTTGIHFSPHFYYFFGLVPGVVIWLAFSFDWIIGNAPVAFPVVAAFVIASTFSDIRKEMPWQDPTIRYYDSLLPEVKARVAPDDRVIIQDLGSRPWHLNPIRRKGWVVHSDVLSNRAFIDDARGKGAKWVIYFDEATKQYRLDTIAEWAASLRADATAPVSGSR